MYTSDPYTFSQPVQLVRSIKLIDQMSFINVVWRNPMLASRLLIWTGSISHATDIIFITLKYIEFSSNNHAHAMIERLVSCLGPRHASNNNSNVLM